MTSEFEDSKCVTANALQAICDAKNKMKILRDRVSPDEMLAVAESHALMLQAVKKMEDALAVYLHKPKK